ncbi:MAG: hypothetical protein ABI224_18565 [Acetobacteraceae bacterium]
MAFGRSAVLACALLAASPARAADLSAAQAAALEAQLHNWLSSLLEPAFALPARPVQLTADGDHLDVVLFVPGLEGNATAVARPGELGTWLVSDIHMPTPASVSFELPIKDGKRINQHTGWTIGEQQGRMVVNPALGVVTSSSFALHGVDVRSDSELGHSRTHYDSYAGESAATPTGNGRLNITQSARAEGMTVHSETDDKPPFDLTVRRFSGHGDLTGVDPARAGRAFAASVKLVAATMAAASTMNTPHDPKQLPPMDREAVRALLVALNDLAVSGQIVETADDLSLRGLDQEVTLAHAAIGLGVEAPGGMLRASIKLAMDGFGAPQLPQQYAGFVPRRIALEPMISGIHTTDLNALLMAATEPEAKPQAMAPAIAKIFADGGVTVGLENVRIETAETTLSGATEVRLSGPQSWQGVARVRASGFDALMDRIKADPTLSQALPFLVLARGLAKPDGDGLAWDIAFDETKKVVVNGTDLSRIAGGGGQRQ